MTSSPLYRDFMPRAGRSFREQWQSPFRRAVLLLLIAGAIWPFVAFFVLYSFFAEVFPSLVLVVLALVIRGVIDGREPIGSDAGTR